MGPRECPSEHTVAAVKYAIKNIINDETEIHRMGMGGTTPN